MNNSNVYLFTFARMGVKFPKEGEIYAGDESSLGNGEIIARFARVDVLEDDYVSESFYVDSSGRWDSDDPNEILADKEFGGKFLGYESNDVVTVMYIDDEASYDLDEDNWSCALDGRLNIEDFDPIRLSGALVVSVQPYYNADVEIDARETYGVKVDGDPSDEHNFSGIFLKPDPAVLDDRLASAEDARDFLEICEEWPEPSIPQIQKAYASAESALEGDTYVPSHISMARIALNIFRKPKEAKAILAKTEQLASNGSFDDFGRSYTYSSIAFFLTGFREQVVGDWREEAIRLLHLAARCVDSTEAIEQIVAVAGGSNRIEDQQLAEQLVGVALESIADSKLKAKIKKAGAEAIKNLC